MGHTLDDWIDRVEHLVRDDGNVDVSVLQVEAAGVLPALGQYSVDRPYEDVTESAGAGSAYLDLPNGWVDGFSRVTSIEYPARRNPPVMLDEQAYAVVRDPTTVATKVILLNGYTPAATEYVRVAFTRPWPEPTADATVDKVDDVAFNAVTALAAGMVLDHLAAQAARRRDGALPTDFVGSDRARDLHNIARAYRDVYAAFLGRGGPGGSGGTAAPVSRRFDYDPGSQSLFHGGRR